AAGLRRVRGLLRRDDRALCGPQDSPIDPPAGARNCGSMMRAFVLVLDSFGIGGAPDAALYGDAGADTLGHIAAVCARGEADNDKRAGPLSLPNLVNMGLANAYGLSTGRALDGIASVDEPNALHGCAT